MSILALFILVVVVGAIVWLIYQTGIPPSFKHASLVIGLIIVGLVALQAFGVLDALSNARVPRVPR